MACATAGLYIIRRLGYQEFNELGKLLGHGWRSRIFIVVVTLNLEH